MWRDVAYHGMTWRDVTILGTGFPPFFHKNRTATFKYINENIFAITVGILRGKNITASTTWTRWRGRFVKRGMNKQDSNQGPRENDNCPSKQNILQLRFQSLL